ncbi:MAG: DNA alkylation repair protein [Acidobacteria bacterium]|nr:DNA alkylation repair protein [Acidobacteriota bacterium]MBI3423850.1 DNA alkylation repair protein [Acidobacteriota bacterium]
MPSTLTALQFSRQLKSCGTAEGVKKNQRFFKGAEYAPDNQMLGVPPGQVFQLAKEFSALPLAEIEKLLESPFYEVRLGAVSIMDFQARQKKTAIAHRQALYELYLRRHDRINNWDLVDRAAPYVVGGWLADQPRTVLAKLARSKNPWERRTAIVSTYYFIRQGEVAETFRIAELLLKDQHELVQKALGSWLREAGKQDRQRLLGFLDRHAAVLPRPALRYAIEKLEPQLRAHYLGLKAANQ